MTARLTAEQRLPKPIQKGRFIGLFWPVDEVRRLGCQACRMGLGPHAHIRNVDNFVDKTVDKGAIPLDPPSRTIPPSDGGDGNRASGAEGQRIGSHTVLRKKSNAKVECRLNCGWWMNFGSSAMETVRAIHIRNEHETVHAASPR